MRKTIAVLLAIAVITPVFASSLVAPVSAHEGETHSGQEPVIQIQINPVGNGEIVKRVTYDLSNSTQKQEFEKLADNSSDLHKERLSSYTSEMQSIADGTNYTKLEETTIITRKSDGTGEVLYAAGFVDLAKTLDDEPKVVFTSLRGVEFNSRVVILAPQAHYVYSAQPTPSGGEINEKIRAVGYDSGNFDDSFKVVFARDFVTFPGNEETATTPNQTEDGQSGASVSEKLRGVFKTIGDTIPGNDDAYVIGGGIAVVLIGVVSVLVYRRRNG